MSQFPQQPMHGYGMKPATPPSSSGKAIASLVLGLVSFCALIFTGIPAIILGFMALSDIKKSGGRMSGQPLAFVGLGLGFLSLFLTVIMLLVLPAMLLPAIQQTRETARSTVSRNNLKKIGLSLHSYHDANNKFPMAGSDSDSSLASEGGQLSWRVHVLPFLGENGLYQQFHLDEPWDSPHNKALIPQMPMIYQSPASAGSVGETSYLAIVLPDSAPSGPATALIKGAQRMMRDIRDGSSNTLLVIDAGPENAVEWTRPADYEVDMKSPRQGLENQLQSGMRVVFVDGSVREIATGVSDDDLRAMYLANDGKTPGY